MDIFTTLIDFITILLALIATAYSVISIVLFPKYLIELITKDIIPIIKNIEYLTDKYIRRKLTYMLLDDFGKILIFTPGFLAAITFIYIVLSGEFILKW